MSITPSPAPVHLDVPNTRSEKIVDGMALCLSGGGYRAMVFHLGCLIRLNELGLLRGLKRISSVSGGSITAGYLALQWKSLSFDANSIATNLMSQVIQPIRAMAGVTIDEGSILGGILTPWKSINDKVVSAYGKHLFGNATLRDIPDDDNGPRFVINATNVQTGALWRFSRPFMGDYRVGLVYSPNVSLAAAVAASSAFPPILSPARLNLANQTFVKDDIATLQRPPYTTEVYLSDGGVYDNLGLETAWKRVRTLLVSDGGQKISPEESPHGDWARHAVRITDIIDNQVRSLRKRQLIKAFQRATDHDGCYWGIGEDIRIYPKSVALKCPLERTQELASAPTRLKAMDAAFQERLINWGYAICAAAIESYVPAAPKRTAQFPFPREV